MLAEKGRGIFCLTPGTTLTPFLNTCTQPLHSQDAANLAEALCFRFQVEVQTFSLLANTYAGMGVSFFILLLAIAHIVWKM